MTTPLLNPLAIPVAIDDNGVVHHPPRRDPTASPLRLYCAGCRAPVDGVTPYTRTIDGTAITVRGHFRLATGHDHDIRCPFDFPRAAARIARAAPRIIRATPTGYLVRIPDVPPPTLRSTRAWRPRRGGALLTQIGAETVTTLGRIAGLMRRFGGQTAAPGTFTVSWRSQTIDWAAFCFDDSSHLHLVHQLENVTAPIPPRAVLLTVERVGQSTTGTSWWAYRNTRQHATVRGQAAAVRLTLRSRQPKLLQTLQPGDTVIGFGRWQLSPGTWQDRYGNTLVAATLWINQRWQLAAAAAD